MLISHTIPDVEMLTIFSQVFRSPAFPSVTFYLDGAHTEQSIHACLEWFIEKVISVFLRRQGWARRHTPQLPSRSKLPTITGTPAVLVKRLPSARPSIYIACGVNLIFMIPISPPPFSPPRRCLGGAVHLVAARYKNKSPSASPDGNGSGRRRRQISEPYRSNKRDQGCSIDAGRHPTSTTPGATAKAARALVQRISRARCLAPLGNPCIGTTKSAARG